MSKITTLGPGTKFLFSVFEKTGETALAAKQLAHQLHLRGVELVASGGTKKMLEEQGHKVTDCAEITGLDPVLDHRVATLCPELHGALLAEEKHLEELNQLGWPVFAGVCCTFYDLKKAMQDNEGYEGINAAVDIGGPTLVRSAIKGGRVVITNKSDMEVLRGILELEFTEGSVEITREEIRMFQLSATRQVMHYLQLEEQFRFDAV